MKESFGIRSIALEKSNITVELYDTLTIGESRAIQRIFLTAGVDFKTGEAPNIQMAGVVFDMQEAGMNALFKRAYQSDTKEDIKVESPVKFLNDLPAQDGANILDLITEITNSSSMTSDAKKN